MADLLLFLKVVVLEAYSWVGFFRAGMVVLTAFVMEEALPVWSGLVDLVQLVDEVVFVESDL